MAVDPFGTDADRPQQARRSDDPGVSAALVVPDGAAGRRLDQWLADRLPDHSRSEVQRWIREGYVTLDGIPAAKTGTKVEAGQSVRLDLPPAAPAAGLHPAPIPLAIVYEDDNLLVVDKPAGMVVHPAPGHSDHTLVNAVLYHCPEIEGVGGEKRPGIVHRLDKETSGLIVVAKNSRSHRQLQAQWKARTVYKEYLALVEGAPDPPAGRISAPIGRHPTARKRQAVLPADPVTGRSRGRPAVTEYHTGAIYSPRLPGGIATFALMRVILHTGRTHQIRVHFAWRRHPVVGDTLYGFRRQRLRVDRQFLHAHRLRFQLPESGREIDLTAPLPGDLQQILQQLEDNSP